MHNWKSTFLLTGVVVLSTLLVLTISPVDAGPPRDRGQLDRGDHGGERRDSKEVGDRKGAGDHPEDPKQRRDGKRAGDREENQHRKQVGDRKERQDRKKAGDERDDDRKRVQERDRRDGWGAAEYKKKRRDWKRRKRSEVQFNIFTRESRRYRGPEWRRERYWKRYRGNPFWYMLNPFWYQYEDPYACDWIFNVAKDTGSRKWQEMYWDCVDYYYE